MAPTRRAFEGPCRTPRGVKGRKQREAYLVADAATYLFDQGFEVLTEVPIGVGRLDAVTVDTHEVLLLEAKIYGHGSTGRAAVKPGLAQLMDYARRSKESPGDIIPTLLVFRLSETPIEVPSVVKVGDYSFLIVHIDLASSAESGRRAPPANVLTAEQVTRLVTTARPGRIRKALPSRRRG